MRLGNQYTLRKLFIVHIITELYTRTQMYTELYICVLLIIQKFFLNTEFFRLKKTRRTVTRRAQRKSSIDEKSIIQFYYWQDISRVMSQNTYANNNGVGYLMQVSLASACSKYRRENPQKELAVKICSFETKNVAVCYSYIGSIVFAFTASMYDTNFLP